MFCFTWSKSNKSTFYLSEKSFIKLKTSTSKSKSLQEQKDVFVLQCYTRPTVSDLRRVNLDAISENRIIIIMQATYTDDAFRLSILPEAKEILLKYDYQPPLMSDQKYKKNL